MFTLYRTSNVVTNRTNRDNLEEHIVVVGILSIGHELCYDVLWYYNSHSGNLNKIIKGVSTRHKALKVFDILSCWATDKGNIRVVLTWEACKQKTQ